MNADSIHIVLASDDNYAQHVAVVAASVLCNTDCSERICFHLLSDGICSAKLSMIESTIKKLNAEIVVYDLSKNSNFDKLFTSGHISKAAYFRLDIADILPHNIKRVIYMDVDLLVFGDIVDLWNIDMGEMPLAATVDLGIMTSHRMMMAKRKSIGLRLESKYFNSGLMVFDLDKWRIHKYFKKIIKEAMDNKFLHHDQDALNKVFMDNWCEVSMKWNVIPPVYNLVPKILFNNTYLFKALEARKSVCILHYAGRYKPWEFECTVGFNDKYYYYLKKTAFANVVMPMNSGNMQGKSLFRQIIRLRLAEFICKII